MTPNGGPPPGSSSFTTGLLFGLMGSLVLGCLMSAGAYLWAKREGAMARKGWNLVPVVVASVDIPESTTLTFEMISQRSVPEQFVTSSVVKPDSASYIINQKVVVPIQAGDMLYWTNFEAAVESATVLFARSDVPSGHPLAEDDVEERKVRKELITPSWIRTEDRPQAVGRKLVAPFRKGDPIMWTHLEQAR